MRNQKYKKQPYKSESQMLEESVRVMQNLPAHCVATARNSYSGTVDIDNVMDRCIDRLETIKVIEDSIESRKDSSAYRRSRVPQFPPAIDLAEAKRIGNEVLAWLQNWEPDVRSDSDYVIHRDPRLVSYHEVTYNEERGIGNMLDHEGSPEDLDDYEYQQSLYS